MVTSGKPLTGVSENMRGFVGRHNLSLEPCVNGRKRVRFDLCAGNANLHTLTFPLWRKCVAYDGLYDTLKNIETGHLLNVSGYVLPQIKYYASKPVFLPWGEPVLDNVIIIEKAVVTDHEKQVNMFEWPPGAFNKVDNQSVRLGSIPE